MLILLSYPSALVHTDLQLPSHVQSPIPQSDLATSTLEAEWTDQSDFDTDL